MKQWQQSLLICISAMFMLDIIDVFAGILVQQVSLSIEVSEYKPPVKKVVARKKLAKKKVAKKKVAKRKSRVW